MFSTLTPKSSKTRCYRREKASFSTRWSQVNYKAFPQTFTQLKTDSRSARHKLNLHVCMSFCSRRVARVDVRLQRVDARRRREAEVLGEGGEADREDGREERGSGRLGEWHRCVELLLTHSLSLLCVCFAFQMDDFWVPTWNSNNNTAAVVNKAFTVTVT